MQKLGERVDTLVAVARVNNIRLPELVRQVKRRWLIQSLHDNNFNQCRVAREMGEHRNTTSRQLAVLDINLPELRAERKPVQPAAPARSAQARA